MRVGMCKCVLSSVRSELSKIFAIGMTLSTFSSTIEMQRETE